MEEKGAETCCEKSYCRIETDKKRDENCGPEGHKHELNADYRTLQWG